jgi:hypothetical protein
MSRNITETEIKKILEYIPLTQSVSSEQQRLINEQQCDVLSSILRTMTIHPEGIETLGEELRKAWNRSLVDPGTSVGMLAAQGIAQPATQGKLKNFSHSGTIRSRSYDADRLVEILEVGASQRYRNMTIVFDNQYITYAEILRDFRPKLVSITLRQLVKDFQTINRIGDTYDNSWWDNYCYIFNIDINSYAPMFLRLYLDTTTMAKYKISMKMIHNVLTTGDNMEFIGVIYSPYDYGILDILVLPNAEITIKSTGGKKEKIRVNDELVFLENVIIPSIVKSDAPEGDIQISGINGIVDMLPVELPLHSLFVSSHNRGRNIYDVFVNKRLEFVYGITRQRLKDVLKEVGAKIVKIPTSELHYLNALPLFIRCECDSDPVKKLETLYSSLKFEKDGVNYRNWHDPQYHRLVYCYGETDGNNLRDVLSIPGINRNHTISNDLREVRDVLGINAANNLIVQEMMIVCETIGFVHQNHLLTISSAMTRNGVILPVNYQGTSKNAGTFTNISFERPMESIMASSIGANEYVASSSTLHGTGRIIGTGTGAMDVFIDEGNNEFVPLKPIPDILPIAKPKLSSIAGIKRPVRRAVDRDVCEPSISVALIYTFSDIDVPVPINYQAMDSNIFASIANNIGLYLNVVLY